MKPILFSITFLLASTFAVEWNGPKPTSIAEDEASLQEGWTPRPTGRPQVPVEILKRDSDGPVCGYESGIASLSLTCSPNYSCLYFTDVGLGACCNGKNYLTDCGLFATCIDYVSYQLSSACSTTCDEFTIVCTNSARPYCQSYIYPEVGVEQFGCGIIGASTWRTAGTSYSGQSSANFANRYTKDLSVKSVPTAAGLTRTGSAKSSSPSATQLLTSNAGDKIDDDDEQHHVSIGAIVGGVVGGLFVLGALLAGGIFLCLRNRKKKRNLAAAAASPTSYNNANNPGSGLPPPEPQPMMQQTQPLPSPPQQFSPPPGPPPPQSPAPGGFYAPPPPIPSHDDKKPAYTAQTQSYHGSDISAPGSPPPPQYVAPHQPGMDGYMQTPPDRQSGAVSPLSGPMTPQHTGIPNNGDNIAQLDGTGVNQPQGGHQGQHGGGGVPGRRPVRQGDVYEAP